MNDNKIDSLEADYDFYDDEVDEDLMKFSTLADVLMGFEEDPDSENEDDVDEEETTD